MYPGSRPGGYITKPHRVPRTRSFVTFLPYTQVRFQVILLIVLSRNLLFTIFLYDLYNAVLRNISIFIFDRLSGMSSRELLPLVDPLTRPSYSNRRIRIVSINDILSELRIYVDIRIQLNIILKKDPLLQKKYCVIPTLLVGSTEIRLSGIRQCHLAVKATRNQTQILKMK